MGYRSTTRNSRFAEECAISVGEHVWMSGRKGEYVVMDVDRKEGRLQVLRVGRLSDLESVPVTSVRAVLAPKGGEANPNAA